MDLQHFSSISHECIRQVVKKTNSVPGASNASCIPAAASEAVVAAMEVVLDLYARPVTIDTAIGMLLENLEKRTPHAINKRCHSVINYALRDEYFEAGKSIIDPPYVVKIEKSELDQEV